VSDEELFRYQVNGSARLRALYEDLLERIRVRFPEGVLSGFSEAVEAGQQRVRNPAFFVGFIGIAFALIATRQIWGQHLPVVGFSLPPAASPTAALGAYAGGWNPGGLGSPEVLPPSVAATALVQVLAFAKAGAAVALIMVVSFVAGVFGMARLLRSWDRIGGRILAGIVLMGGPALGAAAAGTHWGVIPAVTALPGRWGLPRAHGRGIVDCASAAPPGRFLPSGWWRPTSRWRVPPRSRCAVLGGGRCGGPDQDGRPPSSPPSSPCRSIAPWVLYADLPQHPQRRREAFWSPAWILIVLGRRGRRPRLRVNDPVGDRWLGSDAGRSRRARCQAGDRGAGAQVEAAGELLAALGVAAVVGAAFEVNARRRRLGAARTDWQPLVPLRARYSCSPRCSSAARAGRSSR
jgi:hypothetical protein